MEPSLDWSESQEKTLSLSTAPTSEMLLTGVAGVGHGSVPAAAGAISGWLDEARTSIGIWAVDASAVRLLRLQWQDAKMLLQCLRPVCLPHP